MFVHTEIVIINNQEFVILESYEKPLREDSELETLTKIEKVMREKLKYSSTAHDFYSEMTETVLKEELMKKAESIRNNYLNNFMNKIYKTFDFLSSTNEKEIQKQKDEAISQIYQEIEKSFYPQGIPIEIVKHVASFLPITDFENFMLIDKTIRESLEPMEIEKAREFGFIGNDKAEAKDYLKHFFQGIEILVDEGDITEENIIYRKKGLFKNTVNCEATFKQNGDLYKDEKIQSKWKDRLFNYLTDGNYDASIALLQLGVACDINNIENSLGLALTEIANARYPKIGHVNILKHLIKAGADVNIPDIDGCTPLMSSICHFLMNRGNAHETLGNVQVDGYLKIFKLLLNETKVKINEADAKGNTALHLAVIALSEYSDYPPEFPSKVALNEMIKLLYEQGADPNLANKDGKTPLQLAKDKHI